MIRIQWSLVLSAFQSQSRSFISSPALLANDCLPILRSALLWNLVRCGNLLSQYDCFIKVWWMPSGFLLMTVFIMKLIARYLDHCDGLAHSCSWSFYSRGLGSWRLCNAVRQVFVCLCIGCVHSVTHSIHSTTSNKTELQKLLRIDPLIALCEWTLDLSSSFFLYWQFYQSEVSMQDCSQKAHLAPSSGH